MNSFHLCRAKGSALLEALIVGPVTLILISGILFVAYLGYAKLWLDHLAYRSVICLSKHRSKITCQTEISQTARRVLFLGHIHSFQLIRRPSFKCARRRLSCQQFSARLDWSLQKPDQQTLKPRSLLTSSYQFSEASYNL